MKKLFILAVTMLLTISLQAAITNVYEVQIDSANLTFQPTPDDLWQDPTTTNFIMKGNLHGVVPDGTIALYDSTSVGNFGPDAHGFASGCVLFQDGLSPDADVTIDVDFNAPKRVDEIHIFANWGDNRQFAYFDVYGSTTGTNDVDYTKLGTMINGEYGETNDPPNQAYYRAMRLYDTSGAPLMNNVRSIKLVQRNTSYGIAAGSGVMLPPGTPQGAYLAIAGSSIKEIDILGIPEPTLLFSGLLLGLALLRRK